jgi:hypothetical protein
MAVHVIALTKDGVIKAYVESEYDITTDIDQARIARCERSCDALIRKWSNMLNNKGYMHYQRFNGVVAIPVHIMPLSQEAVQRALDNPGISK